MFRFPTYEKLGILNVVIVGREAAAFEIKSLEEVPLFFAKKGTGLYFGFSDKYHP